MYLSDDDIFYVDTCSRYDYCYFMNLSFLLYLKRCKFYLKLNNIDTSSPPPPPPLEGELY